MGIIMKDGRQYGVGGITPAENVTYDNTQSGMSATDVQGAVDELKNGLANIPVIKTGTTTGTTSSTGNFQTNILKENRTILSALIPLSNTIVSVYASTTPYWYFRVTDSSGNPVANTSFSFTYFYI